MSYADPDQLRAKLKVPSGITDAELQRVLDAATLEIQSEIGGDIATPSAEELALLETVNLARAQDLWLIEGLPIGVIGLGGETPLLSPRNSWERHANMLAPLKTSWGIA